MPLMLNVHPEHNERIYKNLSAPDMNATTLATVNGFVKPTTCFKGIQHQYT